MPKFTGKWVSQRTLHLRLWFCKMTMYFSRHMNFCRNIKVFYGFLRFLSHNDSTEIYSNSNTILLAHFFLFIVKVKWGKELYPNIVVDTDEEPLVFKAQLFALTGVAPERQKVMCKGVTLKDVWNVKLSNAMTILMMGSKDEVPAEPVEKTKFIEDMNESELAVAVRKLKKKQVHALMCSVNF